jgi:amicyanin
MSKRISLIVLIVLVIIVAIVAAVAVNHMNNTKKSSSNNTSSMNMNNSSSSSNTSPVATNTVAIENFAFSPASITVKAGTTVTWTNKDTVAHTVTVDSGDGPNSQNLAQNQTYSFTFSKAGTYNYHCAIHSSMHGTVTVTE